MAHVEELQAELKRQQGELSAQKALLADSTLKFVDFVGRGAAFLDWLEKRCADQEKFAEPPATPPGSQDEHPSPSGELHMVEAKQGPELETTEDEELPRELARLEPEKPPPSRGSVFSSPIAISLNNLNNDDGN